MTPRLLGVKKFLSNSAELIQSVKPPIKNTLKLLYKALTTRHAAVRNIHLESLLVYRKFVDLIPLVNSGRGLKFAQYLLAWEGGPGLANRGITHSN